MAKMKKDEYKLPNPLVFRLNNPNYTIYHRAALGGLASTIAAWGKNQPEGITAKVERDEITFSWNGEKLSDQDFLRRLIEASFKLTDDKMIDLPGQRIDAAREDLRLASHNGLRSVFLQHTQTYKSEGFEKIELKIDDASLFLSYQKLKEYAHKDEKKLDFLKSKNVPEFSSMAQWIIPGVIAGAENVERPTDEIVLLMFLIVACPIFQIISQMPKVKQQKRKEHKFQSCLIVPDVVDLVAYAKAIAYINAQSQTLKGFSNNYVNRVVGGVEEAGLRFLLDLRADDLVQGVAYKSVRNCLVIAMGKVAWVNSQVSRSLITKVQGNYDEINVFIAAKEYLGRSKVIKLENGDSFVVPSSPIPELIAANLTNERHWCSNFVSLVSEKKDFQQMMYSIGGLQKMKEEIKDTDDQIIIDVFQEAWKFTMRGLYDRAESRNSDENMDLETRRERVRNEILRAKTTELLAGWFLRFCASATKGGSLPKLRENGERVRKFIFNPRNFERFQNLCFFALLSYASEDKSNQNQTIGEN
ncbi:hypothetical protein BH20ACI1_BH20ACI1_06790 [soil metagenome]